MEVLVGTLMRSMHLREFHPVAVLSERLVPVLGAVLVTALAPLAAAALFLVLVAVTIGLGFLL